MNLKKSKNRKNSNWLHKHREIIFDEVQTGKPLNQIADLLADNAKREGKKINQQILGVYLRRYPFEQPEKKPIQAENAQIATNSTTEKEIEPLSVTKQAADDVSSSVEESRAVTKPDFETPTEPQQKAESEPAPKSTNPFSKLKGKVGKSEPDFIPESSKYY
ncbi:hypothetical protein I7Q67_08350 [Neisseria meningitidis]|nr:hypothetical protein [Neisseria meningitidis]